LLNVTLEMDGEVYWNRSPGTSSSYERLLVPPGRHRFHVMVGGAGQLPRISNSISAAFTPSMRLNLIVEFRPQPGANAAALDPATRVIAILKPSGPSAADDNR
jgi:hypothetical protein